MSYADFKLLGLHRFPTNLYMWGDNTNGLLGDNNTPSYFSWSKISSGGLHTAAIRSDGTLFTWGRNTEGQLGDTTTVNRSSPVQVGTSSWNSIGAGLSHTIAVKGDGTLWGWGANRYGQLGDTTTVSKSSMVQIGALATWTTSTAGGNHAGAINSTGQLFTWGFNGSGQLGDSTILFKSSPVQVGTDNSWLNISAGKTHTVALSTTFKVWTWGDNTYGELGDSTTINRSAPVQIGSSSWSQVSAGGTHTAAIETDGSLFTWGLNSSGQLGLNNSYSGSYWTQISEGPVHTLAIRNDGALFAWGQNDQGQLGLSDTTNRSSPTQIGTSSWTSIDTGDSHSVAIRSDGKLFTWGSNLFGQLGNNPTPINITWSKISVCAFSSHIVAIKSNGTLWAWGANAQGQLGDSTVVLKSSPVQIGTLTTWIDVAAGLQHSLGILNNNVLYAWGYNANGQLGDLTVLTRSSPIIVGYNFKKVFAGDAISAALDINNYLYMWGYNVNGAVGDYTNISRSSPIQIGNSSWSMVSISNHVLALKPDNTLYTWGLNTNGQLGLGDSTVSRSSPTQIGTSSWSAVSAGGTYSVAIRSDGSLFTWGSNLYGQLGLSDVADRNSPVQVGTVTPSNVYSVLFPGGTAYKLTYSNSSINITQSTPWTLEAWVNPNVYPSQGTYDPVTNTGTQYTQPIWNSAGSSLSTYQVLYINYAGNLVFKQGALSSNAIAIIGTINIPLYTWSHVAVCYDGAGTLTLYVNGVIAGSGSSVVTASDFQASTGTSIIGHYSYDTGGTVGGATNNGTFDGYISNFRYVAGVKVYSGTYFTVPTTMLAKTQSASTNISAITGTQTVLLICQNNTFTDNSTWARTIQTNGLSGLTISALIPFTTLVTAIGTNWVSIATGVSNTMAINSLGNLYGWGYNQIGSLGLGDTLNRSSPTQVGTSTWSAVYAGTSFGIAIRSDNSIFAWGGQTFGQLSDYTVISRSSPVQIGTTTANTSSPVQIGNSSWSQVSAGGSHTLGIGVDGILYGWGRNIEGQLGGATNTLGTIWNKVVVGQSHALGIRSDGKLYAWGSNTTGQLGDGTIVAKSSPVLIDGGTWSDIAISQGSSLFYSMGIKSDGRLYAWGNNSVGQLGWLSWRQISVGSGHTLLLRSDGQLYSWGLNNAGQLGDLIAGTTNRSSPIQIGTSTWSTIAAGISVSAAILSDGRLFAWGYNNNGAVGDGSTTSRSSPVQIATASWSQLSAKDYIMATNTQGSLFVWGNNNNGQLGIGTTLSRKAPQLIDGAPITYSVAFNGVGDWLNIASSSSFTFGTNDFTVECWVYPTANTAAQQYTIISNAINAVSNFNWEIQYLNGVIKFTPFTTTGTYATLTGVKVLSLNTWYHVAVVRIGTALSIYINGILDVTTTNSANLNAQNTLQIGSELTAGANYFAGFISNVRVVKGLGVYTGNFVTPTSALTTTQSSAGVNISDITGTQTVLLTCQNNTIIDNASSTFTITQSGTPTTTALNPFSNTTTGSTSWTQIAAGTASLAIKNTGSLFTWGQNNYGQLGSNTTINRSSPVQVGSGSWIAISSSNTGHSLGIDPTYSLYAWGNNSQGELGTNNEYISVSSPVQVLVGYSVTNVSAGNNASIAVTTNNNINTVYTWGLNQAGQLNNINAFTWQRVNNGAALQTSVGSTVGKLYVWGDNTYGQKGLGDTLARSSPVQLGGFTGSATNKLVVTTPLNTAYISFDNSLYMMGDNTYGQLGQNDTISRSSPVLVGVVNAGNWSTIAISGTGHVIGLTYTGTLFAWGNNQYNELGQADAVVSNRSSPVQIGTGSIWTKVSAGNNFSLAIDSTGTGYAWGRNDIGQVGSITPLSYTQVTTYGAIRNDGKLLTWGYNALGKLGTNDTVNRSAPTQVSTLALASTSWIQVASAYNNTAGIKIDRKLYLWGDNTYGQLGVSDNTTRSQPVQIGVSSWTQVYVTASNIYAIRSDNTLWSWGSNNLGQLGQGDTIDRSSPVQIGTNSWSMVVASGTHALALRTDGTLYAWGYNQYNELGQNQRVQTNYSSPMQIGTSSFTTISTGANNSFAIRTDGALFGWGRTDYGQIGVRSDNTNINIPLSWTSVSGGDSYSVAIRSDGKLFSWGRNDKGQLGLGMTINRSAPVQISVPTNYTYNSTFFNGTTDYLTVTGGSTFNFGTGNFTMEAWAYATTISDARAIFNLYSGTYELLLRYAGTTGWQLYYSAAGDAISYTFNSTNSANNFWVHHAVVRISGVMYWYINGVLVGSVANTNNYSDTTLVIGNYNIYYWSGYITNVRIVNGAGVYTQPFIVPIAPLSAISGTVFLGLQNYYFIDNSTANTGTGFTIVPTGTGFSFSSLTPFSYTTFNYSWTQVSATLSHTVAIRNDGTLWAWGANSSGQLGQGDTINRSAPIQIGTSSWSVVRAGNDASFAIRNDGALFGWGDNTNGILGQSNTTNLSSPVQIGTSSWTQISATQHILATTSTNKLFAWGPNTAGQLGDGTTTNRSDPVQIGSSSWSLISAGYSFSMATLSGGVLYTWGLGSDGILGSGTTTSRSSPVAVGASSWSQINAGSSWASAVLGTGALFTWGAGVNGVLGSGATASRSSPVQVGALTTWGVLTGKTHALSVTTAGALFVWGTNTAGQLGDNTTVVKSSPVTVASLTGITFDNVSSPTQIGTSSWTVVSAGDYFTNALRYIDGALFTWGLGTSGQLGSGLTTNRSSPVQVGTSSWLTVSSQGTSNTVAVTIAYTLFGWGTNNNGQVGDNTTVNRSAPVQLGAVGTAFMDIMKSPTVISSGISWTQISAGDSHAMAIRSDTTLWVWGKNDQGQLGGGTTVHRSSPVQIGAGTWSAISAGNSISAAINTAGGLFTWGRGVEGQQGSAASASRSAPTQVGASLWSQIATGANSMMGVTVSNVAFTWGQNNIGQLGLNDTVNRSSPTQLGSNLLASMYQTIYPSPVLLSTGSATSWTQIGIGDSFSAGVDSAGRLYTWGYAAQGQLGDASTINTTPTKSSPSQIATTASSYTFINASSPVQVGTNSYTSVAAGGTHVTAIRSDGTLWGWGVNTYGQAGTLNTVTQTYPRQIEFSNSWTSIAAGNDFSAGIAATSRLLYRWGFNSSNEVAAPYRSAPVQIDSNTFSKVSIINTTAFAITTSGTLYGWGKITTDDNFYFNQIIATIPWASGNLYKDVNAGDSFVHALKNDNTVWTTGANGFGQLGVNDTVIRSSIVQIGSGYSWTLLGGGFNPALNAGALFVTGNNATGQLGLTDLVSRSSPTQVSATNQPLFAYPNRLGISAWSNVSAGGSHSMAIRNDSTLWGWGYNISGQVGDTSVVSRSSPVQIGTSSWIQVSAGKDHTAGIKLDNTLWSWGLNTRGQVGDNSTTNRNSPVQVGTGYWNNVNAGNSHTTALADNNTLYVWGDDSYGQ